MRHDSGYYIPSSSLRSPRCNYRIKPFLASLATLLCISFYLNSKYSTVSNRTIERYERFDQSARENQLEYKKLTEELELLKTMLVDKNKDYIKTILSELNNNKVDIHNGELQEAIIGLKIDLEKLKQHNKHGEDGSSQPFRKFSSYRLLWFATIRSNYINAPPPNDMGGAGFAAEAIDFIIPLCKKYSMFGWIEEVSPWKWQQSFFFKELSNYEQHLLIKCNERGVELLTMDDIPAIAILQYLPHDYVKIRTIHHKHLSKIDYVIGRAMFESDNVPPAWRPMINDNVDEVWVPTLFHVKSFSTHGVSVPVVNVGEGFDPVRFNREITQSDRAGLFPGCNEGDYIFITASQYINRKGFDILFEAYVKAFGASDKVCLAVRANGLDKLEFKNPEGLRTCEVERLSGDNYTAFFKSGDVFISTSHGEGWGRTNQQAMAMGLPTILPLWGGITGYATEDTIIPIIVDELEQAFPHQGKNWLMGRERLANQWAKVEVSRVVEAMRWVYEHQEEARVIGRKAEQHMRKHYTRSKVADTVLNRTNHIFKEIEDKY